MGHVEAVEYLVEQGADKEAQDNYGCTPLRHASGRGHGKVVKYLVEQGADDRKLRSGRRGSI